MPPELGRIEPSPRDGPFEDRADRVSMQATLPYPAMPVDSAEQCSLFDPG